ncbi:putative secreted protein (Por secretion system target) [Taibaiella chishuiensis]|uniref:Putative secreted protein (Por secretion system target) n=2 Tax=Taibaiella chishuiensis TaxID=1434707 RepID=A0A2P8DD43_9BACT|nr:putative secreted protein (Por secretion system target) [Taibaiella chishuiensis]
MKRLFYFLPVLILTLAAQAQVKDTRQGAAKTKALGRSLPFVFAENRGQVTDKAGKARPDILFTAHDNNARLFLDRSGIHYQFSRVVTGKDKQATTQLHLFSLQLLGANAQPVIRNEGQTLFRENYYTANTPAAGITNIATYEKIVYENIYPHIDWVVYSKGKSLKYDFIVHPGGDPASIRLQIKDAEKVSLTADGGLLMQTSLGKVQEQAPQSFSNGKPVPSKFVQYEDGTIGFTVRANPAETLVIDPSVTWSTYYGGSGLEDAQGFAMDASGNLFIGGVTSSTSGIATASGFSTTIQGGNDNFLVKFGPAGTPLWGTYYGSVNTAVPNSNGESGGACATDNAGNVYMTGTIKTPMATNITTTGAYQTVHGGDWDAYLVKFNGSGIRQWATFFGGSAAENAYGCSTDATGNVYLSGTTGSTNGIASPGAYQTSLSGTSDMFLAKFNSAGAIQWSTYFGGPGEEGVSTGFYTSIHNTATDNAGNVVLAGITNSTSGIASTGAQQTAYGGQQDAFLVKFSPAGARLWSTYYGGPDQESDGSASVAVDAADNIFLTATTYSTTGIATTGAYQTTNAGGGDNMLVKFNSSGVRQWATYQGASSWEYYPTVTTNALGNVILTSSTYSTSGFNTAGGFQATHAGLSDGLIVKFSGAGAMMWTSYIGGPSTDALSSALTSGQDIFLLGRTQSTTGIATAGAYKTTLTGTEFDAFLTKINDIPPCVNDTVPQAVTICSSQLPYTWHGISVPAGGTAVASYTLTNIGGCDSILFLNLTVKPTPTPVTVKDTTCRNTMPFAWNGLTVAAPPTGNTATATYTTPAANGCDSVVNLQLYIRDTAKVTVTKTYCRNMLPAVWNGFTIPATAVSNPAFAVFAGTNQAGCDSTVTLNLVVRESYALHVNDTICRNALPLSWNGLTVNVAPGSNTTTAVFNGTSSQGCDSVVTLHLYVKEPSTGTVNQVICSNQLPYLWHGISVTAGGPAAAVFTTPNAAGCDSVITLNLTVKNTSTATDNKTICSNQLPYVWNSITVTTGGTGVATYTTPNAAGCDSIVTLNLTVKNASTGIDNKTICSAQLPYLWHGISVSAGGTAAATFTMPNAVNCDSVITLNLTVVPSVPPSITITAAPATTVPVGTPVTFTATLTNGGTAPVLKWKKNGLNVGFNSASYTDFSIDSGDVVTCVLVSNATCATTDSAVSNSITISVITPPPPCLVPVSLISTDIRFSNAVFRWARVPGAAGYEFVLDMQPGNPSSGMFTTDTVYHASALTPGVYYFHIRTRCANGDYSPWITISIIVQDENSTGIIDLNGNDKKLSLYPNPNNGIFNVKGSLAASKATVDIIDKAGRIIYRRDLSVPGGKLDHRIELTPATAQGVYLLRVVSGNEVYAVRFVYN